MILLSYPAVNIIDFVVVGDFAVNDVAVSSVVFGAVIMSKTAVFDVAVCATTVYSQHCKWYLKNFRRSRLKIF